MGLPILPKLGLPIPLAAAILIPVLSSRPHIVRLTSLAVSKSAARQLLVSAPASLLSLENVADECMIFSSGGFRSSSGAYQSAMLTSVSPSTCPAMNNTSYTAVGSTKAFRISCNVTFDGTLVTEYARAMSIRASIYVAQIRALVWA